MKYVVLGTLVGFATLVSLGMVGFLSQPANATDLFNFCKTHPQVCEPVTVPPHWWWWKCPGCPEGIDLGDIITLPENQSFSVSVKHGPVSDTIMIEIPKALSSAMLNESAVVDPKPEIP